MGIPGIYWAVRALNSLQKSIALRPREPSTGPIGGEGVAWPAGHMNFTGVRRRLERDVPVSTRIVEAAFLDMVPDCTSANKQRKTFDEVRVNWDSQQSHSRLEREMVAGRRLTGTTELYQSEMQGQVGNKRVSTLLKLTSILLSNYY